MVVVLLAGYFGWLRLPVLLLAPTTPREEDETASVYVAETPDEVGSVALLVIKGADKDAVAMTGNDEDDNRYDEG